MTDTKGVKTTQPSFEASLSRGAEESLARLNGRNRVGSDSILVNPMLEGITDEDLFSDLEGILESVTLTSKLRSIEDANRSIFGPRSLSKNWSDRKASLDAYFEPKSTHSEVPIVTPFYSEARAPLRPLSIENAAKRLISSSSSGLPYMQKKRQVLEDNSLEEIDAGYGKYPCVLYTRTAEERKTRNVWGYPIADTLNELRVYTPFQSLEKTLDWRSALIGPDSVDSAVSRMLLNKADDDVVFCVDFSAYDASVSQELIAAAFSIISSAFSKDTVDLVNSLTERFINIPIITPDGERTGPHGVPSGSTFTNTIDSLVQWICADGFNSTCQIQGDDGVYIIKSKDVEGLTGKFKSLGLKINPDKSETFNSTEAIYLQRYYHPDYRSNIGTLGGVYSLYRAMARIKYLETWTDFESLGIDGGDFFSLRAITILENCKYHPGFREFVQLVQSFDYDGLIFSEHGLKAYSRSLLPKTRAGVFNQYGESLGIANFETVKILNETR